MTSCSHPCATPPASHVFLCVSPHVRLPAKGTQRSSDRMSPKGDASSILMGDWNFVMESEDRLCLRTMDFTGRADKIDTRCTSTPRTRATSLHTREFYGKVQNLPHLRQPPRLRPTRQTIQRSYTTTHQAIHSQAHHVCEDFQTNTS